MITLTYEKFHQLFKLNLPQYVHPANTSVSLYFAYWDSATQISLISQLSIQRSENTHRKLPCVPA